jgi:hypothetical protein
MKYHVAPCTAFALLGALTAVASPQATPPALADQETFRTAVVLLTIDVQVTPSKDAPLRELTLADFQVTVSGRSRPVASAAFLHLDEESVVSNPPRPGQASGSDCVFEFHRKLDRPTAHYRLGIQPVETDRGAREVKVNITDPAFATQWLVWRLPIR